MRKTFWLFLVLLLPFVVYSQNWTHFIGGESKPNFYRIVEQAGKYAANEAGENQELFKRWEYFWRYRIDKRTGFFPNTTPAEEFYKVYGKNYRSSGDWTSLGPSSSMGGYAGIGRINTIAFHPADTNVFWIGAPAGGLWQTTDGGNSWTVLTDSNAVLGVSAIAIPPDFDTSHIIYIGTGDRDGYSNFSAGVLKSADGGVTWQQTGLIFDPADLVVVNNMRINPDSPAVIYAATSDGLYKTTDYAATWTKISSEEFVDIELCPGFPDTIFAATRDGEIYRSLNGGADWTVVFNNSSAHRIELAVSAANPAVVYAVAAASDNGLYGVFKSVDYGATFSLIFDDLNLLDWGNGTGSFGQGWYDLALAVNPQNENDVYLGGVNTWHSTDGGLSWQLANHWYGGYGVQAVHADKHYLAFRNNDTVLYECNDGGIYKTYNGQLWFDLSNGLVISQMYGLSTAQTVDNQVITGLQDNGTKLMVSENWYDVLGGDGMLCQIDYTNELIQYGSLYYGNIYRTLDGWESNYTEISANIPGGASGIWVTPYLIDPVDHETIYIGYSQLWKSEDMGETFESIGTFPQNITHLAICPNNSQYIYASTDNGLYRTTNGGESWEDISAGLPLQDAYIGSICVKDNDPNTVWVTFGGFNQYGVFVSDDGGQTWTNISDGLPQIPVNYIIRNKLEAQYDQLYVGTDFGVFVKNGDSAWRPFDKKLPKVVVTGLDIYYDYENPENSRLRASTYGRGLWESPLQLSGNYVPYVSTVSASDIDTVSATLTGEIINNFGFDISESGFVVGTSPTVSYGDSGIITVQTEPTVTNGTLSLRVSDLTPGTVYYFRAYAINQNGIGYGAPVKFSTKCTSVKTLPWYCDVENEGDFPVCFDNELLTTTVKWYVDSGNDGNPPQAYSGNYNFAVKASVSDAGEVRLLSPVFDFSGYQNVKIRFWAVNAPLFSTVDGFYLQYKNSPSADWQTIADLSYAIPDWTAFEFELPDLSGYYQFGFLANTGHGKGISVDSLSVFPFVANVENIDANFAFSPNPAANYIYVFAQRKGTLTVSSITGKILLVKTIENQAVIDISNFENGVYVLTFSTDKGIAVKKLIKM